MLFNIYKCDHFLCDCETNVVNYADNTILYASEPNMDFLLSKLEKDKSTVFTWFQNNYLKANSLKNHIFYEHLTISSILMLGGINSVVASMKNY